MFLINMGVVLINMGVVTSHDLSPQKPCLGGGEGKGKDEGMRNT